ncbi:uncharacterized protein LOC143793063 [Ranitomeya variabilis]|uniref:uncharacterized protein LOC143793063 n=1 Tax=Ranitomeya variabilis TaxID=490064 RepID=UPI004056E04C
MARKMDTAPCASGCKEMTCPKAEDNLLICNGGKRVMKKPDLGEMAESDACIATDQQIMMKNSECRNGEGAVPAYPRSLEVDPCPLQPADPKPLEQIAEPSPPILASESAEEEPQRAEQRSGTASEEPRSGLRPIPAPLLMDQIGIDGTTSGAGTESAPAPPHEPASTIGPHLSEGRRFSAGLMVLPPDALGRMVPPLPTRMGEPVDVSPDGVVLRWDNPWVGTDGSRENGFTLAVLTWEQYRQCLILHWEGRKEVELMGPLKVQQSPPAWDDRDAVRRGTVLAYHVKRGWGLIHEPGLDTDVFVAHCNVRTPCCGRGREPLQKGDQVTYNRHQNPLGWYARNVRRCMSGAATLTTPDLVPGAPDLVTIATVRLVAATELASRVHLHVRATGTGATAAGGPDPRPPEQE